MKEADDVNEVCYVINQMEGEYTYAYDEELSGTWYERNKKGVIVTGDEKMEIFTPTTIGIIVGVGVVVIAGAAFLLKSKKKKSESNEPVYQGGTML